jgi:peptidoglycan hydrolase-like protein with peptidoglycan-binding domain
MRQFLVWAVMGALLVLGVDSASAGGAGKKKTSAKKSFVAPAKKKSSPRPATTWRNRQLAPTPERYREIQQALAAKGYLRPEDVTGNWGDTSADALRRFQADQKLESSGKINSLSLIALGLGSKRDPGPAVKPPAPPEPEAPPESGR